MKTEKSIFAAGCFWGIECYFQKAKGVLTTVAGSMVVKTRTITKLSFHCIRI